MLVAGFLRLGRLDTSSFAGDQRVLFAMAYDAIHNGLIPITSNRASILIPHQPLSIYILAIPVLFSADPLWATIMTGLFNVIAVLLAYIFTRRYYGRLTAAIATSLFATAETVIVFSRFIWQPTLIGPFVMLFLFTLFWGVVERRKGWLFPAVLLLGCIYQLHESSLLLVAPLFVAILLVPQTIRVRDVVLALVSLLLLSAPYIVWEVMTHFADVFIVLHTLKAHAVIDFRIVAYYERFLDGYYYDNPFAHDTRFFTSTYYDPTGSASSVVYPILPLLAWARQILLMLLVGGFAIAAVFVLRFRVASGQSDGDALPPKGQMDISRFFASLYGWWLGLRAAPYRCGLLILLVWQLVPLLALMRHSAPVHLHYLLMLPPGPYIFIGLCITQLLLWLRRGEAGRLWQGIRYGMAVLVVLLCIVQLVGSTASLLDTANGINNHIFGYNAIGSLDHAVQEADQVAQQHHFHRVYIAATTATDSLAALSQLAKNMQTPSTLFDPTHCLVLPTPSEGPAVLLIRSENTADQALLSSFTSAVLVDQPPISGAAPFKLYIVTPNAVPRPTNTGFANNLQLLAPQAEQLPDASSKLMVARWLLLRNEQPGSFVTYTYSMAAKTQTLGNFYSDCMLTSMRAGDQLLTAFALPANMVLPTLSITSQFLRVAAPILSAGPLRFEAFDPPFDPQATTVTLSAMDGGNAVMVIT